MIQARDERKEKERDGRMEGWKDGNKEQKIECKRNGKQKTRKGMDK